MSTADLAKHKVRSVIEACVLDADQKSMHKTFGARKQAAIGAMSGTVVELGPGTGVNMRYYGPGVHVIGIEPNPIMHHKLQAKADAHGVDLEIRTEAGERLGDVADASADGVVGTLVLCGVEDPVAVLAEVRRVLKPGAPYFFLEHVAAPDGSRVRSLQKAAKRPHRWMFNGCEVDRTTEAVIRSAGFAALDVETVDLGPRGAYVRFMIIGTATA